MPGPVIGIPELGPTLLMLGLYLLAYAMFARTFPMISPRLAEITLDRERGHAIVAAEFEHEEMFRQTGHLQLYEKGIALKGLIIRHLVLPEGKAGSRDTLRWIAETLGTETHIALMSQYFPAGEAVHSAGINRPLTQDEYTAATAALEEYGLENGWVQELEEERGAV